MKYYDRCSVEIPEPLALWVKRQTKGECMDQIEREENRRKISKMLPSSPDPRDKHIFTDDERSWMGFRL